VFSKALPAETPSASAEAAEGCAGFVEKFEDVFLRVTASGKTRCSAAVKKATWLVQEGEFRRGCIGPVRSVADIAHSFFTAERRNVRF
jgi:AMMECR1 domain-containing protein